MKKIFSIILIIIIYNIGNSQIFKDPKNIFPYAPETSSLVKYQETPVSNYTGVPNISIPVYTAKSGNIEVPITLSYHSGGILVSEIASSVGLGWSISTVAPITRKVNGYTDENGVMENNDNIEGFLNSDIDNRQLRLNLATNGLSNASIADLMSDEFSISVDNFSGNFLYNPQNKKIVTFPMSDLKFDYYTKILSSTKKQIDTINVTATNGTKYTFGGDGVETFAYTGSIQASNYFGANAWKIKKIKGRDNNEIIFSYLTNTIFKKDLAPQTRSIPYTNYVFTTGCGINSSTPSPQVPEYETQYTTREALLEKIETSDANITFIYSNRLDFNDLKKLDKIIIKNKSGELISEKRFYYDYFQSLADPSGAVDATEDLTKRLKLLSYDECDRNNKCVTTSFQYYEDNKMSQRLSYATDHWGYFNNKFNNYGYPDVPIKYLGTSNNTVNGYTSDLGVAIARVADKSVNSEYVKTYSLKSITYPEGGKNEFIYEPNTASTLLYQPQSEHYFLEQNNLVTRNESFSVSGYVEKENMYVGSPSQPTLSDANSKTYIKEIDLSGYNKQYKLTLTQSSNFRASTFSNFLNDSYLYAELSISYYENGIKKYWFKDAPLNGTVITNYNSSNNSAFPNTKIYVEIKHVYWGGLGNNISDYLIPFSSQVNIEWQEVGSSSNAEPNITGGGIRIKEIKQYDNNGQYKYSTKYSYTKEGNNQLSSGVLFNIPMYTKNTRIGEIRSGTCSDNSGVGIVKTVQDAIELSVKPVIAGMRTQGQTIGYTNVEVIKTDASNNIKGREIFQYFVEPPLQTGDNFLAITESTSARYEFMESRDWRNGQLLKYVALNNSNDTVKVTKREFYFSGPPSASPNYHQERNIKMLLYNLISPIDYVAGGTALRNTSEGASSMDPTVYINGIYPSYIGLNTNISPGYFPVFVKHNDAFLLKQELTTDYFSNGRKKASITEYFYDEPLYPTQLTSKKESLEEGKSMNTEYSYAYEKGNQKLIDANMTGIPLETTITQTIGSTSKILSKTETRYDNSAHLFPTSVKSYDLQTPTTSYTEVTYDQYDSRGNLQQYTTKDGVPVAIVWGYNQTQPIAKIEGATYAQVSSLASAIITASNTDASATVNNDESALLAALDSFRNNSALSGYQISTYSYDPLIGVRSITPPSGIREYYIYDSANRLEKVVDSNGNILKEYKYNYKQ